MRRGVILEDMTVPDGLTAQPNQVLNSGPASNRLSKNEWDCTFAGVTEPCRGWYHESIQ